MRNANTAKITLLAKRLGETVYNEEKHYRGHADNLFIEMAK